MNKMKCYMCLVLFLIIITQSLLLTSCENNSSVPYDYFAEYVTSDEEKLESAITKEYDLNELTAFFEGKCANEGESIKNNSRAWVYDEVNQSFPIEVFRSPGYSVYRVAQGGYFYVFWIWGTQDIDTSTGIPTYDDEEDWIPTVYFTAYLTSDKRNKNMFDSLIAGSSTAEDVRKIDPSFELNFLLSHGIYSYTYLDNRYILTVKYYHPQGVYDGYDYDDLVVESVSLELRRDALASSYASIFSKDLP